MKTSQQYLQEAKEQIAEKNGHKHHSSIMMNIKLIDEAALLAIENAQRDAQPKWIDVNIELPEIGDEVIVFSPKSNGGNGRVTALSRLIRYEGAVEFYWDNNYGGSNIYIQKSITHWQPLPSAPKQLEP